MFSPSIQKLIELFSKFPTIGHRSASRFVFYLIETPQEKIEELIKSISVLKEKIKVCPLCFSSFEPEREEKICGFCADESRDKSVVCLVEKEVDLEAIEKTKQYKGLYFILGKKEIMEQRVEILIEKIKKNEPKIKEIILALNSTAGGENASLWLQRKFKILTCNIVQLGRGLPVNGELEYADEETLSAALEGRK